MTAELDPLYDEAARLVQRWSVFSRPTFQRHMRVGWIKRDTLLLALEDEGVIEVCMGDRNRFRVVNKET